jgi:hypothetical protein
VLRVLEIRQRPFYNLRHTFISIALTLAVIESGLRSKANQRGMIQEYYGKYIRDDGDALLRAYVKEPNQPQSSGNRNLYRIQGVPN